MKLSLRQILDSPIIIAVALLLLVLIVNKNLEHPLVVDEAKKELMRMTFGVEALTDDFLESIATRQDGRDFEPLNGYPSSDSPERRAFFKKYSPADRGMVRSSQVGRPLMVHGLLRQNNCLAAPYNRDSPERRAFFKTYSPADRGVVESSQVGSTPKWTRVMRSKPLDGSPLRGDSPERRAFLRHDQVSISKTLVGLQPWAVVGGHAQAVAAISEKIPIIVSRIHLKYNDGSFHFSNSISQDTGPHRWCKSPSSFKIHLRCVRSDGPHLHQFVMRTQNERTQTEGQIPGGADVATSPETFYNLIQELVHDHGGPDQLRHDLWQLYIVAAGNDDQPWSPRDHADYALLVYQLCEVLTKEGGAV